ncbi:MAG: hypothetical protein ACK4RF_05350 [Cyclobacteriaceae bacterium]
MRLLNFLLAAFFLILASFQVNVKNPVIWIIIFGAMSVSCIFAVFEYFPKHFLVILCGLLLVGGLYLEWQPQPSGWYWANGPIGLVVCGAVLVLHAMRAYRLR